MFTEEEIDFMKKYVEFRDSLIVFGTIIFNESSINTYNIFVKILKELEGNNE